MENSGKPLIRQKDKNIEMHPYKHFFIATKEAFLHELKIIKGDKEIRIEKGIGTRGVFEYPDKKQEVKNIMRPVGYYVLIKMEEIKNEVKEGALKGFQLESDHEFDRTKGAHDVGVIVAFGPLVYTGFRGIEEKTAEKRAEIYGIKIGDKVEFNRYDGKIPRHQEEENFRLILDEDVLGVYDD